ncbi:ATP-binding protein, partial [Chitinophaga sp.]|uniref:ATP-binding protein n=1 Tax=Chitinophaga sp. TaxID=1869181 RepID=UPI002F95A9D3
MKKENQNIEWKETWRDEYLKWICGFANAQGGTLVIGINDDGMITGINNAHQLLEEIPNKVRDMLGIIVDVNIQEEKETQYLEVMVDAYPHLVSYKGQYHYRSGSTKQELKGAALDKFLLQRQGKRWDGVPVPKVPIGSLSKDAFSFFRRNATQSGRLPPDMLREANKLLLGHLNLYDGTYLKRAAVLLFHPDPEKFVSGAFVKIGFFRTDDDLLFQDTIHGCLFEQVNKVMDLLLTKYLKAAISYEGITRVEAYPFPEAAIREAILNAIAHKDYSRGVPVQISVYDDKIIFWNPGHLPDDWTVERLKRKHPSLPYNPDIATAFFRVGLIETWGRGTIKIMNECIRAGLPEPAFNYDLSGFMIEFKAKNIGKLAGETSELAGETSEMAGETSEMAGETLEMAGETSELAGET